MKDKKFLILIGVNIIVLSLIVVGFILYSKYSKIVPSAPPIFEPFISPEDVIEPETYLTNLENCLTGKEEPPLNPKANWQDEIYLVAKALSEKSEMACLKLKEEEGKDRCLDYFYKEKAIRGQIDCQKLKDTKEQSICFAFKKNDSNYCQKIKNSFLKEICLATILGIEYCNRLTGVYDVTGYAFELESYGIEGIKIIRERGEVSEQEARSLCKKSFYFLQALKEKNPEICEKEEFKTDSFKKIICRILSVSEPQKEWEALRQKICYEKFGPTIALLKKDSSICQKIPFKDAHNRGLYNFCLGQLK